MTDIPEFTPPSEWSPEGERDLESEMMKAVEEYVLALQKGAEWLRASARVIQKETEACLRSVDLLKKKNALTERLLLMLEAKLDKMEREA